MCVLGLDQRTSPQHGAHLARSNARLSSARGKRKHSPGSHDAEISQERIAVTANSFWHRGCSLKGFAAAAYGGAMSSSFC
jgi:hypothetical protein